MKNILSVIFILTGIVGFAQQNSKDSYIKKESVGGKLDFSKRIEEKYSNSTQINFVDTTFSKKEYAVLLWGANVRTLGIESLENASKLWEEINRRILTDSEKKALKTGFEAKF